MHFLVQGTRLVHCHYGFGARRAFFKSWWMQWIADGFRAAGAKEGRAFSPMDPRRLCWATVGGAFFLMACHALAPGYEQGTRAETAEQFLPGGEELQQWSPSSNMVTILLDCDGHHGHRGKSLTQRSRTTWIAMATLVTAATSFSGESSTSWAVAALEVVTANSEWLEEARGKFQVAKIPGGGGVVSSWSLTFPCTRGTNLQVSQGWKTRTVHESFEPVKGGTRSSKRCLSEE